jgi:ABC-2 type transport system ATP-binding protein
VYGLIEGLRARGATIFLTTHRLEEAERLCDRVAILNTTLRTIGPPNELRNRLFATAIQVRTAAPLADADAVFGSVPGFTRWQRDDDGSYLVTVADPTAAAPAITRALATAGADVIAIGESRHSLEDVYLQLVDDQPGGAAR